MHRPHSLWRWEDWRVEPPINENILLVGEKENQQELVCRLVDFH